MSDQDFFFDEDEKPASKSGAKKGSTSRGGSSSAPQAAESVSEQSVTLVVAVLIGVIGILLGVVIGLFIGKGMATSAIPTTTVGVGTGASIPAPQLTQDQLNAGQLPPNHPKVTGTEEATPTK